MEQRKTIRRTHTSHSLIFKRFPWAADLLSKVKLDTDIVSAMTYALVVEKADPEEFAKSWVAANGKTVDSWLK